MKTLIALIAAALVVGCGPHATRFGTRTDTPDARDICYKGILYVQFSPNLNSAWGSVRLDRDTGNVIKCEMVK